MSNAIETINLGKTYKGGVEALKSLDLTVKRGESIGYLGPNGAGKTTTIQILLNLIRPSNGEALVFGETLIGQERKVLQNVGALVELPGFYDYLTPNDLLKHICKIYRIPRGEMKRTIKDTLEQVNIYEVENKKIGTFSTGMQRRLAISTALVHNPELLILDEPTIGLDPKGVREIRDLVKQLNKDGKTIFLTSHNLTEVSEISDRVVFLKKGQLIKDENMVNLQQQLSSRQIEIKFLKELNSSQKNFVESIDNVIRADFGKITYLEYNGANMDTHNILQTMLDNKLPVYSFTPKSMTLEDLYLNLYREENI